jgi:hypothetical protein
MRPQDHAGALVNSADADESLPGLIQALPSVFLGLALPLRLTDTNNSTAYAYSPVALTPSAASSISWKTTPNDGCACFPTTKADRHPPRNNFCSTRASSTTALNASAPAAFTYARHTQQPAGPPPAATAREHHPLPFPAVPVRRSGAAAEGPVVPVYVPENGFIGINVPLTRARVGSASTRTTYPRFMGLRARASTAIGSVLSPVVNPYRLCAKGELLAESHNAGLLRRLGPVGDKTAVELVDDEPPVGGLQ